MTTESITTIKDLLKAPKKIVVLPHRNPDGDAMGSTLGLAYYLKKRKHEVTVISPNEFPDFLAWLPGSDQVKIFEKETDACTDILKNAELIFTLDFNALHRTGELMESVLKELKTPFAMIDHHQSPDPYAVFTYSDTSIGSTCEMVYHFINTLEEQNWLDAAIATCLYTGIVTDTGSFKYSSTTSTTHKVVAALMETGIDNGKIHNLLFDNQSFNRIQLLGKALQNLAVIENYQTSYITLTQKELDSHHYQKGDTEGIVNYGLSIKGIIFTATFIENKEEGIIKISFRSQGNFDVNRFARAHFSGGGHINAAGGKSALTMAETIDYFKECIRNYPELKKNERNHDTVLTYTTDKL